jgi:hypothetical protein
MLAIGAETAGPRGTRWAWLRSVLVALGLSLLCLRSSFRSGYLLQVDAVFGPRSGPILPGFQVPVTLLQNAAAHVVGGAATGKILFVGTLFLAAFAPMVLFRRARWYAQCAAGLLAALNPWVYDRMIEGQWTVVVAAAGLFLWLAAWDELQARPSLARALLLAATAAAITAFDPHVLGPLLVLLTGTAVGERVWRDRERLRWTFASIVMLAVLLAYGVVSFFAARYSGSYVAVRQFTRADFAFFRSTSSPDFGLVVNLVGLSGYWGERIGRFPLATADAEWWPVTTAVIVGAALAGAWLRRDRAWLLLCGVIGLAVSASTAVPGGVDAAVWVASRIPLAGAYREPEKWSALWLVALVVLATSAIEALAASRSSRRLAAPALAYAVILAALFPAGSAQIRTLRTVVRPVLYPDYWYASAAYLRKHVPRDEPVAVLPWHLYQPLRATGGRLAANPARVFFPGRLVVPHNLEIPGRETEITSRYDRIGLVAGGTVGPSCALARELRLLRIRWVLILDGAESSSTVLSLRRCGFSVVQGRPGFTAVLRG